MQATCVSGAVGIPNEPGAMRLGSPPRRKKAAADRISPRIAGGLVVVQPLIRQPGCNAVGFRISAVAMKDCQTIRRLKETGHALQWKRWSAWKAMRSWLCNQSFGEALVRPAATVGLNHEQQLDHHSMMHTDRRDRLHIMSLVT